MNRAPLPWSAPRGASSPTSPVLRAPPTSRHPSRLASFPSVGGTSLLTVFRVPGRLPRARCATRAGLGLGVRLARRSASGRGDDETSQVPGAPPCPCRALRPRWSLGAHDPRALRRGLPLTVRRRPPRSLTFGAPSHGPRTRCLRFAAGLTDGHARLASGWGSASTGRHVPHRQAPQEVSATIIRSSLPPPPGLPGAHSL